MMIVMMNYYSESLFYALFIESRHYYNESSGPQIGRIVCTGPCGCNQISVVRGNVRVGVRWQERVEVTQWP